MNLRATLLLILLVIGSPMTWAEAASDLDPRYPAMQHWARAGVRGGVPTGQPATLHLRPGDDLPQALSSLSAEGGVVQLAAGEYILRETLSLPSHVVLRGATDGSTKLHLQMRGEFPRQKIDPSTQWATGLLLEKVERAGLEHLTISFDESLPPPPTLRTAPAAFINHPEQTDLFVVAVRLTNARDCWLRDVRILNSGSHPLMIERSCHITARDVVIDGTHNKGDWGNGYLNVTKSEYVLLDRLQVRDIRHVSIQNADDEHPCRYNVLIRSHLLVDVNFHNGDSGDNLVQDCVIDIPVWHWWGPFAAGVPNQHLPPGPGNLIFRCVARRTFPNAERNFAVATDPALVYAMRDSFDREVPLAREVGPAPVGGSLFVPAWPMILDEASLRQP